jgi:hypothetical protein
MSFLPFSAEIWRDEFVLARDARALGRRANVERMLHSGELIPLARGVYRRRALVRLGDPDDTFLARVRAIQLGSSAPIAFSGLTAAAVWGLPLVGPAPERITVASASAGGGRSNQSFSRSAAGSPAPVEWRNGLLVTSLARTIADVARTCDFAQAVAICDAGLRGQKPTKWRDFRAPASRSDVADQLIAFGHGRGVVAARAVVEFADGASGSAGESVSRALIRQLGFPAPRLQMPFFDRRGHIGDVDFWWPEFNLIGEFDGNGKYLREEFTNGRSPGEIVIAEKRREDRLRALGPQVTRWDWSIARSAFRLRAHLADAGLS